MKNWKERVLQFLKVELRLRFKMLILHHAPALWFLFKDGKDQ